MWVLAEDHSRRAMALARRLQRTGVRMIGPAFMPAEVSNAIHKSVRRGDLGLDQAQVALQRVLAAPIDLQEEALLHVEALSLASELGQATTYDCHYLALAHRFQCEFWTADRRLISSVGDRFPLIRWIGDLSEGESPD